MCGERFGVEVGKREWGSFDSAQDEGRILGVGESGGWEGVGCFGAAQPALHRPHSLLAMCQSNDETCANRCSCEWQSLEQLT